MSEENQLESLQREWREGVTNSLKDLAKVQKEMNDKLGLMASRSELEVLNTRVNKLESMQSKIIGGLIILNIILGFVLHFIH